MGRANLCNSGRHFENEGTESYGGVFGDNSQSQSPLGLTVLSLPLNSSCSLLPCWSSQNRFGISAWLKVENLNSTTCCLKVLKTRTQNALPTEY